MATLEEARAAKEALARRLGDDPAVNGLGIARAGDGYEVKVNLREATTVPADVDGVPVRAVVVGEITTQ